MCSSPDLKNPILGTQITPRWSKIKPFSSGEAQNCPRDPRRRVGLHILQRIAKPVPRDPGGHLYHPAPAPGPRETTFNYCFQLILLQLLASNKWFLVDPHATTLVPRGRRIFTFRLGAGAWGLGADIKLVQWGTGVRGRRDREGRIGAEKIDREGRILAEKNR